MSKKYASQLESAGNSVSHCISTKDALKLSILDPLEKLLVMFYLLFKHMIQEKKCTNCFLAAAG